MGHRSAPVRRASHPVATPKRQASTTPEAPPGIPLRWARPKEADCTAMATPAGLRVNSALRGTPRHIHSSAAALTAPRVTAVALRVPCQAATPRLSSSRRKKARRRADGGPTTAKHDNTESFLTGKIPLDGGDGAPARPALSIHALDESGTILATSQVDESGTFSIDDAAVAKARRVAVTARGANPATDTAVLFRPDALRRTIAAGVVAIAAPDWLGFLSIERCIDATIRHCHPSSHLVGEVMSYVSTLTTAVQVADVALLRPVHRRCAPICEGAVEVYRRTCCCRPIIVDPPVIIDPRITIPHP